jgi:hypothetical protein
MLASDIITRCSRTLFDNTQVRWPTAELLDYITEAERQIVLLRPDAAPKNEAVRMVGGTRQELPAGAARLLRVVRNMGTAGTAPGRAVRFADREALDNENPDWHTQSPSLVVQHFFHDNVDPRRFYVFPPVTGTNGTPASCYVECIYSAIPAAVTTSGQTLTLPDQYINPVVDWVLFRAYTKDASYAGNIQRAQMHIANFSTALGVTMRAEWATALQAAQIRDNAPAAAVVNAAAG